MSSTSSVVWIAVAIGEYSIAFTALKLMWLYTLFFVRRHKDELRTPFLWLKWAIPLYLLFAGLEIGVLAINVIILTTDVYSTSSLSAAGEHLGNIASFSSSIADVFMLLCLVEVNLSCLQAQGTASFQKAMRYCNFVFVAVLTILAIAALAENESWFARTDDFTLFVSWDTGAHIYSAEIIVWWITSLPIVVLSLSVLVIAYRNQRMRWIARRLLTVSILNLVRCTWELYYTVRYTVNYSIYEQIPDFVGVTDPILYTWLTVAMVGLLMAISLKRHNGLWNDQCVLPA